LAGRHEDAERHLVGADAVRYFPAIEHTDDAATLVRRVSHLIRRSEHPFTPATSVDAGCIGRTQSA
jgi:hypothetical protein